MHGVGFDGVQVEAAGRTDAAIARDLLRGAGVDDAAIDARADEVFAGAVAAYAELCPDDLSAYVAPGVPEALAALATDAAVYRQALVTGNLEPIARRKLAAAGIGDRFAPGQGGFGSDAEDRAELPAIARARAGGWARERTVVIGDTPRDIACARADRRAGDRGRDGAVRRRGPGRRGRRRGRRPRRAAGPGGLGRYGLTTSAEPPPRRTGSAAASIRPPGRNSIPVAAPISAAALNVCPFASSAVL